MERGFFWSIQDTFLPTNEVVIINSVNAMCNKRPVRVIRVMEINGKESSLKYENNIIGEIILASPHS